MAAWGIQPLRLTTPQPPPSFWKRGCGVSTAVSCPFNLYWTHNIGKDVGSVMFSVVLPNRNDVPLAKWNCCKVWFASNPFPMQEKRLIFFSCFLWVKKDGKSWGQGRWTILKWGLQWGLKNHTIIKYPELTGIHKDHQNWAPGPA